MKIAIYTILIISFLSSCSDNPSLMDGQWQLKTITLGEDVQSVDTVFYCFQNQSVFAFGIMLGEEDYRLFYGYADYPSDNKVHVHIDWNYANEDFLNYSGWGSSDKVFNIKTVDRSYLVLTDPESQKVYTFNRY